MSQISQGDFSGSFLAGGYLTDTSAWMFINKFADLTRGTEKKSLKYI